MKGKKEPQKKKQIRIKPTVLECIPHAFYDKEVDAYQLVDGTYLDLFQMKPKDLMEVGEEEEKYDILRMEKFYCTFGEDVKLIALNFPSDTSKQLAFFEHKLKEIRNPLHKEWLEVKKAELEWLQEHKTSREYYMMHFSTSREALEKSRTTLQALLTGGEALIEKLPSEKKHLICRKLNNKNSIIG